jgi:membrane protease YdiL (CAAX protease family)
MHENELPIDSILDALPANGSTSPSADVPFLAESGDAAAIVPSDVPLETRSFVQEPRWPHPSFGWALLWCLLLWIVMQLPAAFLLVLVLAGMAILSPTSLPMETLKNPDELLKSDAMNVALALGQFFAEILVIGFSWLVIRLAVGRDWKRQIAVRRPGLAHTLLVVASLPAVVLGANIVYSLMRDSKIVPSISDPNPLNLLYFWIAVFSVLGAAVLAAWLLAGFGWTRKLATRPAQPSDILIAGAGLLVLVVCVLAVYAGMRSAFRAPGLDSMKLSGMEEMSEIFGKWPLSFAVLVIGLGPGIGEELWCRGFLGRGLVGSHGVVLGVIASSFLFGLIHTDPCQGTMAMVMGLWLHFIYLSTRSLWLPMLLHFLNNSLSVMILHIPWIHRLDAKPQDIPVAVYITGLLLLGAVAYALYQSRARLAARSPDLPLIWRPAFEGVEYPPTGSGMRVEHPMLSPLAAQLAGGAFLLFLGACVAWFSQG